MSSRMDKIIKLIEKETRAKGNQDYVTALYDTSLQVDLEVIKIMERKREEEREKADSKVHSPRAR